MKGKDVKECLRNGDRVYGTHIVSMGNPVEARMKTALEMDFVFICTEHMPIDRTEVSMMCQFYAANGISPIVRVPYPSAHWAGMLMDAGADGIVAPYVETLEQVSELVGAVKYRPIKGKFLKDIISGKREPTPKLGEYLRKWNENNYLIIGIESVEAIENLEKLIDNDGVDGVFLGPHDITCSMEIPEEFDNPKFIAAITDVIQRCRKLDKGVGFHGKLDNYIDTELNFVLNKADVAIMREKLNGEFADIRHRKGDVYKGHDALAGVDEIKQCVK